VSGVRHVVMFEFTEGTTDEQIAAMTAGLETLPGLIPEIREYHVGPDLGLNEGNHRYAVVADFATEADYLTYRDHPAHLAVIAERVRPILATRAAVQFGI
jgi:hypothetical protein